MEAALKVCLLKFEILVPFLCFLSIQCNSMHISGLIAAMQVYWFSEMLYVMWDTCSPNVSPKSKNCTILTFANMLDSSSVFIWLGNYRSMRGHNFSLTKPIRGACTCCCLNTSVPFFICASIQLAIQNQIQDSMGTDWFQIDKTPEAINIEFLQPTF